MTRNHQKTPPIIANHQQTTAGYQQTTKIYQQGTTNDQVDLF